ncbi:hypothetical protein K504DRAFT_491933 [Pleomassaria siparia CBS 279.74]|uniref:Uncharacterized protein n=1 Tax=Pleomassaria siparia CBS 279.74 TaxID=1314801 RepID=A0A6G1K715_9PLEO|nr:hypothetical protein K504DRAFT_491933 [Pleomassaria siparia CBS 279.74]
MLVVLVLMLVVLLLQLLVMGGQQFAIWFVGGRGEKLAKTRPSVGAKPSQVQRGRNPGGSHMFTAGTGTAYHSRREKATVHSNYMSITSLMRPYHEIDANIMAESDLEAIKSIS